MAASFKHLFRPISIGSLEVPNRIYMPPLRLRYDLGRYSDFYVERARGGAGLLCCNLLTLPREAPGPNAAAIEADSRIAGLRAMTDAMHAHGTKVAAQLAARPDWRKDDGTVELVGPSSVSVSLRAGTPESRPLSLDEIRYVVDGFADAARRARAAGFDAVELHSLGGTSLLSTFLSPLTNKREDAYGGSLERRMRLILDTLQSIAAKAGEDFPVIVRISGDEFMPGGHGIEEAKQIAAILERHGVAALNVTTGWYRVCQVPFIHMGTPQGAWVYLAEGVKQAVTIPVIGGTNIRDPWYAEGLLAEGRVDLTYIARALIADPEFPLKAREDRVGEIRPCVACCNCMDTNEERGLECAVNAAAGREAVAQIIPAAAPKKVLVVGGGPAGMEAARVAAVRGHRVTLWEGSGQLGGALLEAALPPRKETIGNITRHLERGIRAAGVDVVLGKRATAGDVLAQNADAVVVATGALPIVPELPGFAGDNVVLAGELLTGMKQVGQKVVVIGGEMVGCEVAEHLAAQGKEVTILARRKRVGEDIGRTHRWLTSKRLRELGVRSEVGVNVVEVREDGVVGLQEGASRFFAADSVVIAVGFRSDNGLFRSLEGKVGALHAIGDCAEPDRIASAVRAGFDLACVL